ncbi:hypothetical protein LCGC14_2311870 [marine sediment metagenome]|uniref:Uncharacterized protein n=1 Tax=marine sediment metagenome TaxID=412755 RepID=A0A0F9FFB2_9ZZZZ
MNWKNRYDWRKLESIDDVKPGMFAKLNVGDEKAWVPGAWIVGRKGQIFMVKRAQKNFPTPSIQVYVLKSVQPVNGKIFTIGEYMEAFNSGIDKDNCACNWNWFLYQDAVVKK